MPQYNWQSSVCDKHKLIMFNYASEQVNDKKHLVEVTHSTEHELDVNIDEVFAVSHSCIIREVLDGNISFRFLLVSFTKWPPKNSSFG